MKNFDNQNCCDYGCNQGRNCPARATNTTEVDVLRAAQWVAVGMVAVCTVIGAAWLYANLVN